VPSHFSSIGFVLETSEQFKDLALDAACRGERVPAQTGDYICFAPGAGVELWVQVVDSTTVVGCNPHFRGQGRLRLGLTRVIANTEHILDGGVYGWVDPRAGDPESGAYPVFIDVPDFAVLQEHSLPPCTIDLQVAAFAHELRVFATEDDSANNGERLRLAPEAFIPSGLFYPGGEARDPLRAEGIFAGRILATELLTNPVTTRQFYWLLIKTFAAVIDVVADPILVTEQPRVGGLVQGAGWLTGRAIPEP
jgi:hypothetical protein